MRPLLLALSILVLAACDSGSDDDLGRFEATVTGDVSASLVGDATFSRTRFPDGTSALTVSMVPSGAPVGGAPGGGLPATSIGIVDTRGALTGTGTYPLDGETARSLGLLYFDVSSDMATLAARTGTLTVTRFEGDWIDGTFRADLAEFFGEDGVRARVEGSFSARRVTSPR